MKTVVFPLLLAWVLPASSLFGQSAEEETIMNVIATEVQAFLDGTEALADYWHLTPYSRLLVSFTEGGEHWTWLPDRDDLQDWLPKQKEKQEGARLTHSNHQIRISGDLAAAVYDQLVEYPDGRVVTSAEVKVLEKVDGVWKISLGSVHVYPKE